MKDARFIVQTIFATIVASTTAMTQTATIAAVDVIKAAADKPPVEIINFKIGVEYYPMLDRPGTTTPPMTAESGDMPRPSNEQNARQGRSRFRVPPEDRRSSGRILSYTRVIDNAQIIQVEVRNVEAKPIIGVDWDFAFPRYENGQLLSRYNVTSKIGIKPGGKKTLKHELPPGAKRCEVVRVIGDENQPEKTSAFEAVCGKGFHDPSLLNQKQETISIIRIEYSDGSEWKRR